ncbi:hypothetical protein ACTGXO_12410, partial [Streptococcus suis]
KLILLFCLLLSGFVSLQSTAFAAQLDKYLPVLKVQELFQDADRIGTPQGEPPIAPVYKNQDLLGYIYLNSDFTSSVGYSGKPIHILVGIDTKGI